MKLGGHFILSLYSGQEAIKSIDCPNNGDTILYQPAFTGTSPTWVVSRRTSLENCFSERRLVLIDKIIDQELGYRLIFNGTESDRDKVFSVTVVYEELTPKQTPHIQPLS